ncbi:hypothetical protein WICPIJ_001767 [Wickerhamomyces pijperi]|uniref:Uncharacterized protein n=1 Tax=Wickerhamomyces pijperi TaxID=599730 RepID=A0A9P8QB29_WICPI|nr:hypothetical protein WICPIJ_001767 [Wickerhamomyces pijperi]
MNPPPPIPELNELIAPIHKATETAASAAKPPFSKIWAPIWEHSSISEETAPFKDFWSKVWSGFKEGSLIKGSISMPLSAAMENISSELDWWKSIVSWLLLAWVSKEVKYRKQAKDNKTRVGLRYLLLKMLNLGWMVGVFSDKYLKPDALIVLCHWFQILNMAEEGRDLTYEVKGKTAIITLTQPEQFNALNHDQYLLLAKLIERANVEPNTVFTLIQSTGRYFSAGANVKSVSLLDNKQLDEIEETKYWLNNFTARNAYLTDVFYTHKKVLVCALNGPVIGLSSGLVALCDLIYSINDNDKDVFLLAPFANLGLVSEGAAAYTLLARLGLSVANEALLLSRPITAKRLLSTGFINKSFQFKRGESQLFNEAVLKEIEDNSKTLTAESIFDIKSIIKSTYLKDLESVNAKEIIGGLHKWLKHIPQEKFKKISQREMKHKL